MAELTDEQKVMRNATGQYIGDQVKLLRYLLAGGLPDGGADGQLLRKKGSEDYSLEWYTPNYAPNDSPALAGTPTAPTAASGTNSTQLATTAFVQQEKHLGITGASVGDLIRVGAVDANGKPTSWEHVPLYPSNENLLDNWYFVGGGSQLGDGVFPINQRGQASYSVNAICIDRWRQTYGTVKVLADSIQIVSTGAWQGIFQITSARASNGNTFTFSFLADGSASEGTSSILYAGFGYMSGTTRKIVSEKYLTFSATKQLFTFTATLPDAYNGEPLYVNIWSRYDNQNINIYAAKLELGSYQTLAHNEGTEADPNWVLNELPDFGEELAKCQRYYVRFSKKYITTGFVSSGAKRYYMPIYLPQPMTSPTVTMTGWVGRLYNGYCAYTSDGNAKAPTNIANYQNSGNCLTIYDEIATVVDNNNNIVSYMIDGLEITST